ncbi:hypothetical protein O4H61_09065 [Roseovarius aestuarii]|nr:hypothetical protein [Roseovarius aestuarii]
MNALKLQGIVRGGKVITTNRDAAQPCPDAKANREFVVPVPNRFWVSDFPPAEFCWFAFRKMLTPKIIYVFDLINLTLIAHCDNRNEIDF